jgi:hypothetical protein
MGDPSPVRADRDPFADVGRELRRSIERAIAAGGLNRLARVYLAIVYLTAAYSRFGDRVFVAQIAEVAQIAGDSDYRHLRRELAKLARHGVISWEAGRGRGKSSWVGLMPQKTGPKLAPVSVGKTGPDPLGKEGQIERKNRARSGAATEKTSREGLPTSSSFHPKSIASFAVDAHQENVDGLAAAQSETPRESAVREACTLHGADQRVVEPLARQLDAEGFAAVSEATSHRVRTGRGQVRNRAGLFVTLLRCEADSRRRHAERFVEQGAGLSLEDEVAVDCAHYAMSECPWDAAEDLLRAKFRRRRVAAEDVDRLTEIGREAYAKREAKGEAEEAA